MKRFILLLSCVLIAPVARGVDTVEVTAPLQGDRTFFTRTFDPSSSIMTSFDFVNPPYNVTAPLPVNVADFPNGSIRQAEIKVLYRVGEHEHTWVDSTFTYTTSLIVNGTYYVNITTKETSVGLDSWQTCKDLTTFDTLTHRAQSFRGSCDTNFIGGNPNIVVHHVTWDYLTAQCAFVWSNDEESDPQSYLFPGDSLDNNGAGPCTHGMTSLSVNMYNEANDITTNTMTWFFTNFTNHAATMENVTFGGTDTPSSCWEFKSIGGIFSLPIPNPICILGEFLDGILTLLNKGLDFIFSLFPGGEDLANVFKELVAIGIGIPIMLFEILLVNPGASLMFIMWYATMIGIVAYAFGASFASIWEYPIALGRALVRSIVGLAKIFFQIGGWVLNALGAAIP